MGVIKSHWRMVYRATIKAIKVTYQVLLNNLKLRYSLQLFREDVLARRNFVEAVENNLKNQ